MYEYEDGVRSKDDWILYGGLTPLRARTMLEDLQAQRDLARAGREAQWKLGHAQAVKDAQPRVETFRRLLSEVGITPPEYVQLHTVNYDGSSVEISYDLVRIPEADEPPTAHRFRRTRPHRIVSAVLTNDDQLHLSVTGPPENSLSTSQETWDAGPYRSEADLARVIDARGNCRWSPPAPAPVPKPAPKPTAAEIARQLLDGLYEEDANRQGPRGIALAQAYATLAATEHHAQADDES